ncbi:MAG: hypothetical protein COU51_02020 [Parcubacteria group bacterium CG10_big_fil_rev_8_21_14_0_10_36_14]|nr:MAG: hypothetical protein COU51_02020 [Parcubacteria group bacterium CG10_big_fil_rev_8_21_14_0_10_36_14]
MEITITWAWVQWAGVVLFALSFIVFLEVVCQTITALDSVMGYDGSFYRCSFFGSLQWLLRVFFSNSLFWRVFCFSAVCQENGFLVK